MQRSKYPTASDQHRWMQFRKSGLSFWPFLPEEKEEQEEEVVEVEGGGGGGRGGLLDAILQLSGNVWENVGRSEPKMALDFNSARSGMAKAAPSRLRNHFHSGWMHSGCIPP